MKMSPNNFLKNLILSKSFKRNLKTDLLSGFILFLIALPLSIGISLASGTPATAGLLSAIVGGILGSIICGGNVMINGPAAGLIVVVLTSVHELGKGDLVSGFKLTLAAIFVAGIIQILLGLLKAGTLGLAIPASVLNGMLASIGVTIVAKQIFVLCGVKAAGHDTLSQIAELPEAFMNANWVILFLGVLCLGLILALNFGAKTNKRLQLLPTSLVAVIVGVLFDRILDLDHLHTLKIFTHSFNVGELLLLHVPLGLADAFATPDFSMLGQAVFWKMALTICFVASIESVLSAHAVDRIDPLRRNSNLNFDLVSKGICNTVLGLIGGLPIITEIVRSTANIANGAKSRWSNFYHGVFILLFLVLFPAVLNLIPLASFAAVLIVVGFRLCHPRNFIRAYVMGWDQFSVFMVTLLVSLRTDILIGIGAGLTLELTLNIFRIKGISGLRNSKFSKFATLDQTTITLNSPATFTHVIKAKKSFDEVPATHHIFLDLSQSRFIDHTFMDFIETNRRDFEKRGRIFSLILSAEHVGSSQHRLSAKSLN